MRYGIKARFAGVCSVCGAPTEVRERIFQLPKKRTGPGRRPWVCAACRFPDPDRVVDLDFLTRKLEQGLIRGPSYTPTMAGVDLLVTVMGYVEILDEDELLLLRRLQAAQHSRRSPTFGRAKISKPIAPAELIRRRRKQDEGELSLALVTGPYVRRS